MPVLDALQRLFAYLFLVCVGTIAAALVLVRLSAWLGVSTAAPGGGDPMETAVTALVMAMTGSGIGWLATVAAARLPWGAAAALMRRWRQADGRDRIVYALWAVGGVLLLGLLAGLW